MNGLTKTIIALLPAVAAHVLAFLVRDSTTKAELWLGLAIGLLVLGGILSAIFLVGAMFKNKTGTGNKVLAVVLFIVFVLGYVATFFFTGCFLAFAASDLF